MIRWIAILGGTGLVVYLGYWYATSPLLDDGLVNTVYLAYIKDPVVYILFAALFVLLLWAASRIFPRRHA